jgi:uncharacterized protein YggE
MKILPIAFFILATSLCTSGQAIAADSLEVPTIVVKGKSEILVEPDYALITVDFSKTDRNLQAAQKANEEGVAKVLELARRYGIPATDVSTNAISVSMKYLSIRDPNKRIFDEDGEEIGTKVFDGYEVSRSVSIKFSDLTKFQEFFDAILKTGPTGVDEVSFETSRIRELKDRARELAMVAAKEKAIAMTRAIGQTVGKALKITEESNESKYLSTNYAIMSNVTTRSEVTTHLTKQSLAAFSPGTVKVESTVTIVFKLD